MAKGLWLIDGHYLFASMLDFKKTNTTYKDRNMNYHKLKKRIITEFGLSSIDGFYFDTNEDKKAFLASLKSAEPYGPGIIVRIYDTKAKTGLQRGVDVGIATMAMRLYSRYDVIILSAGDGDYEDCVEHLVVDQNKTLYIVGYAGNISPEIQQYSKGVMLINEHYLDICE